MQRGVLHRRGWLARTPNIQRRSRYDTKAATVRRRPGRHRPGTGSSLTNIKDTHAPDPVYDEARRHFSEKELADLSIAIAMINAWNRLAISSRSVHPDDIARAA